MNPYHNKYNLPLDAGLQREVILRKNGSLNQKCVPVVERIIMVSSDFLKPLMSNIPK